MVVPQVDVDGVLRRDLLAPQFARGKAHGVDVLRVFTEEVRVGIGKDEHAMIALDGSKFSARVPGQSSMTGRIEVARADALANTEPGRCRRICGWPVRRWRRVANTFSAVSGGVCFLESRAGLPLSTSARVTRPLVTSSSVMPDQELLVVADAQIVRRRNQLFQRDVMRR